MIFYTGDAFPSWKGNILIGGLASNALIRLVMQNGTVARDCVMNASPRATRTGTPRAAPRAAR